MMNVTAATARLSREIPEAESAIDHALISVSSVFVTSMTARRDAGVPTSTGQDAIMRLHKTLGALIDAQNDMLRTHTKMLSVAREVGVMDEPHCPEHTASIDQLTDEPVVRQIAS